MEASTRYINTDLSRYLVKEDTYLVRNNHDSTFVMHEVFGGLKQHCSVNHLDLIDLPGVTPDELKAVVYVHDKFYHFFVESLPLILKLHKIDKKIKFILYIKMSEDINSQPFLDVLFDVLKDLEVKYLVVNSTSKDKFFPACKISNFIRTDETVFNLHSELSLKDVEYAMSVLKKKYLDVELESREPFRKIYLAMGSSAKEFGDVYTSDGSYGDDARMNDEHKLQEHFLAAGYEVFMSEEKFATIPEQIKYMSEVAVLASVSSSALTNSLFMKPGGQVIEIVAEVVVPSGVDDKGYVKTRQAIPAEYSPLSFLMGHTHLMIPTNRDADLAIKKLKAAGVFS
jgi:hypothetical protein